MIKKFITVLIFCFIAAIAADPLFEVIKDDLTEPEVEGLTNLLSIGLIKAKSLFDVPDIPQNNCDPLASLAGDQPMENVVQQIALLSLKLVRQVQNAEGPVPGLNIVKKVASNSWIPAFVYGLSRIIELIKSKIQ